MVAEFLPPGYGWVLFFVVVTCFQLTMMGFGTMLLRRKFFTKKFFEEHFPEELKRGACDLKTGYPDVGNGQYAMKLSHDEWKEMNNNLRPHLNFLETITPVVVVMLVAGLGYTRTTVILQAIYCFGRFVYSVGYVKYGPDGRFLGALIFDLAFFPLISMAFMTTWSLGGGLNGLQELVIGK